MSKIRKWLKKLLAVSLSTAMIGGTAIALPTIVVNSDISVSAASSTVYIYTAQDLLNIRSSATLGNSYILMNDIDLSDTEWKQIPVFIGTLDGNG